jgi:prepilin signal peptidase PulO-like enzyme (type II secretory pathway)
MLIFFFLFGLATGSFLNSVIYRLDTGESLIKTRSHCPCCKKTLSWMELIPVVSFILQRGRCKHCRKPISLQYPLIELATGILFLLVISNSKFLISNEVFNAQFLISVIFWLFVISCLIIIFVYDLKHYIIPDQVVYPAIIVAILYNLYSSLITHHSSLFYNLLAAVIAGGFFLLIILISRGKWMGMGDAKLAFFMGLVLGWPKILHALFLAFLIGAFVSVILMILKKKTLKSEIPLGPFLAAATVIAMFFGDILINLYLKLFI